jgi:hypothetical protein
MDGMGLLGENVVNLRIKTESDAYISCKVSVFYLHRT